MKKILILFIIMFSFFNKSFANYTQLAHEFQFKGIQGEMSLMNVRKLPEAKTTSGTKKGKKND